MIFGFISKTFNLTSISVRFKSLIFEITKFREKLAKLNSLILYMAYDTQNEPDDTSFVKIGYAI